MKTILFTDTHFGVRQNSIHWLESQLEFIEKQMLPYIQKIHEPVKLIHLGDVFDSRSSISTLVATKIKAVFNTLAESVDSFIILAGNHDFYSPNSNEVDTINLVLGDNDKIKIITKECYIEGSNMYVPWYEWFNQEKIQELVDKNNVKNIFTHADIVTSPVNIIGPIVYSGHIHIPSLCNRLRNLGSCYALNFADANSERGFYEIDDSELKFIPNSKSIKFWRLYDLEIFNDVKLNNIKKGDYIELYINQENLSKEQYNNTINNIVNKYKNVRVIPNINNNEIEFRDFKSYDIENVIKDFIPDKLNDKFKKIINYKNEHIG